MKNKQTLPQRIKSVIYNSLNWIGFSFRDFAQWNAYYGTNNDTGERVTADRAMTIAAVWACVRLYAQTVSTLPLGVYEKGKAGRTSVDNLPIVPIITMKPNADMTAQLFWENMIAAVVLRGNAYAEKRRVGGRIVALEFMHPDCVAPEKTEEGGYRYIYTDTMGEKRTLSESDVFHIPGFATCGKFGMSVIEYGAGVFGSAFASNKAANKTFANGLHPTVAFEYPEILKDHQREQARETIQTLSGSANAGKPIILEAGMKAMPIGINPNDAQLLESRNFSVDEVCSWFGLFPVMIGFGDKSSSWASSSENLNLWWLQYSLRALLKRVESSIWDQLFSDAEKRRYYAEFSVEGLLRADTQSRTNFYSTALQNGWMNRNEVRQLENLSPVEGGDIYTVQSNLIPTEKLGADDPIDAALAANLTGE